MEKLRKGHVTAHPKKKALIFSTLITALVFNLIIQIWLLYTSLNNALDDNKYVTLTAFGFSLLMFLASVTWLRYLPKNQ